MIRISAFIVFVMVVACSESEPELKFVDSAPRPDARPETPDADTTPDADVTPDADWFVPDADWGGWPDAWSVDAVPPVLCSSKIANLYTPSTTSTTTLTTDAAVGTTPAQYIAAALLDQSMRPDILQVHFLEQGVFASTIAAGTYTLANNPDLFSLIFVNVDFNADTDEGLYYSTAGSVVVNSFGGTTQNWDIDFDVLNADYLEIDRATGQPHPNLCSTTILDLNVVASCGTCAF